MRKWTRYMLLMSVLFVQAFSSCSLIDEPTDDNTADMKANLAFNVSVNRSVTRMSDAVTQQIGQVYRGIQDIKIFPFDIKGAIGADATPLEGMTYDMQQYEAGMNYYDNHTVTIPDGTASFLCYAKAVPENKKFENGSISPTWGTTTSTISFAPEVIQSNVEVVEEDEPSKIAAYLTQIANAIKDAGQDDLFREFINEGHLVACSSTNVQKLAEWAQTNGITLHTTPSDLPTDYPSDILLPDGAAVVQWQKPAGESAYRFVPQTQTTPEANINSLNRFIYPAELLYYANSRIMTSVSSQINHFSESWESILSNYEFDNGVMDASIHSVAIKDPLSYAVGCRQIGIVTSSPLSDAAETPTTIELNKDNNTFPLTAVFVSGQYQQKFDFTPNTNDDEKIIYDPIITGISMGGSQSSTPSVTVPSKWVNTLVLQTQDHTNVRFALEFENNSENDFQGADGRIFQGTKFYLVGTIEIPTGQSDDWKKRAFTKNYITQGIVRINSLQQAYPYLPDLLDPRLEIAVKLVPNWIQSTTTNVPL